MALGAAAGYITLALVGLAYQLSLSTIAATGPYLLAAVAFLGLAFVLALRPLDEPAPRLFFLAFLVISAELATTAALDLWPRRSPMWQVGRRIEDIAFWLAGSLTLHTALSFPHPAPALCHRWFTIALHTSIPAAFLVAFQTLGPVPADRVAHLLIAVYCSLAIVTFVYQYRRTQSLTERYQLRWLLWGLGVGLIPYLVLVAIPRALEGAPLLPEEFTLLPMLAVPVAGLVAVFRYRLLDIDVVIHRTVTTALMTASIALLYGVGLAALSWLGSRLAAGAAWERQAQWLLVLTLAALLYPLGIYLHGRVLRWMFPQPLREEALILRLSQALPSLADVVALLDWTADCLTEMGLTHSAIAVIREGHFLLRTGERLMAPDPPFPSSDWADLAAPCHANDAPADLHAAGLLPFFPLLYVPLRDGPRLTGVLALGTKTSAAPYSSADLEALAAFGRYLGWTMGRLAASPRLPGRITDYGPVALPSGKLVLVACTDAAMGRFVQTTLEGAKFRVRRVPEGADVYDWLAERPADVVILQGRWPAGPAEEVCRQVRQLSDVPVLVITDVSARHAAAGLLDAGADDVMAGLPGPEEMVSRVWACLRRTQPPAGLEPDRCLIAGPLLIDFARRRVTLSGQEVRLTPTEFELLQILVRQPGRIVTYRELLREVWGDAAQEDVHLLWPHIHNLRHKIEPDPAHPSFIQTEPGLGYFFERQRP
jgi:two-component system KDP operon response regulator KdpE